VQSAFERSFSAEVVVSSPPVVVAAAVPKPRKELLTDDVLTSSVRSSYLQYVRDSFKRCLDLVKSHTMKPVAVAGAPAGLYKINTWLPFLKAVDPTKYPDYYEVIKTPIDLTKIEKKITGDKYFANPPSGATVPVLQFSAFLAAAVKSFVADMRLMRDNAHTYNIGQAGIEVRLMADTLLDFFEAVLRSEIKEWMKLIEPPSLVKCLSAGDLKDLLKAADTEAAVSFIAENNIGFGFRPPVKGISRIASFATESIGDTVSVSTDNPALEKVSKGKQPPKKRDAIIVAPQSLPQQDLETSYVLDDLDEGTFAPSKDVYTDRAYAPWEQACIDMLQRLKKHEYVDQKRAGCIGNFFLPVVDIHPGIRDDYLAIIAEPMDLDKVESRLATNGLLDAENFLEMVLLVFENAVRYNADHQDSDYALKLTKKCRHLVGT
jgi:hypothetical protein